MCLHDLLNAQCNFLVHLVTYFGFFYAICSDIDECLNGMAECVNGTICENILGGYQCISKQKVKRKCPKGFFKFAGKCIGTFLFSKLF